MPETLPSGFRRASASGLIVPEAQSRVRQVIPWADWRAIERATKVLDALGVRLFLGCTHADCQTAPIRRLRRPDGGITLQCAHADREVARAI